MISIAEQTGERVINHVIEELTDKYISNTVRRVIMRHLILVEEHIKEFEKDSIILQHTFQKSSFHLQLIPFDKRSEAKFLISKLLDFLEKDTGKSFETRRRIYFWQLQNAFGLASEVYDLLSKAGMAIQSSVFASTCKITLFGMNSTEYFWTQLEQLWNDAAQTSSWLPAYSNEILHGMIDYYGNCSPNYEILE